MNKSKMKKQYNVNNKKVVGDSCHCASCNAEFTKTHYQQKFCKTKTGTKCKDRYWNIVDDNKRNNITRISPASASYMSTKGSRNISPSFGGVAFGEDNDFDEDDFDFCDCIDDDMF